MNEKLKQLAEKAGFFFYDLHNIDGEDLGETIEADDWSVIERFANFIIEDYKESLEVTMRDNSGNSLRAIWTHPELYGQYVSGLTRQEAQLLVKVITGKDLSEDGFTRTGKFHYKCRLFSGDIYEKLKIAPKGHFLENW